MAQNKIDIYVRRESFYVSFDIDFDNELIWIKGDTGSGKSTILRTIAGLEAIEKGYIEIGGDVYFNNRLNLSPVERRTCIMSQDDVLYPWLNGRENILFNVSKNVIFENTDLFNEIIEELEITDLLYKTPDKLSGGQKKRISIARTLFSQPKIILMDEPFSALNKSIRIKINQYICKYSKTFNVPLLLVSHQRVIGAERIIEIDKGKVVRDITVKTDVKENLYRRV